MKRGLKNLMFLVVFGLIFVSLVGSVDADCPIGMVSYWKFDETSGTTAGDSADGNPGNLVNGPVWTTGQVNGALNFDGVNDYVDAGNGQSLNLSGKKITVSAWFLTKSFPVGGHPDYFDRIVNKDDGATDGQYSLGIRKLTAGDTPHLTFKTSSGGSSYNAGNSSTTQVVANTWYHVVGVNNGASNLIYVNGVLKHSIASGAIGGLGADSLYIGYNHPENPIYSYYFTGTIDEVAIFNRALSAAEISELYEKGLAGKDYCYSECSLGETSCSGANYLTCNGWSWTNNGKVDGFCENLCQPDDIIMKLYSPRNSHGALWDYSGEYDWHICYSDIFGAAYIGTSPHDCTGSNKVVGLFSENNSHAEIPSLDNYTVDVCYGDLVCEVEEGVENTCANGGEIVARLYQDSNSHISNASDINYPIKICCTPEEEGIVKGAYWANMLEPPVQISEANVNDRVKLMVAGSGMENKEINYTIYKSVAFWFDKKLAQTSTIGFTSWVANITGEFYFTADVEGVGSQTSGNLDVTSPEDNEPPYANILTPNICEIYFTGETVSFTQSSYDEDDNIAINWSFGDGSTSTEYNVNYSYTIGGQKTIILTITDERGLIASDRTTILVVDASKTEPEKYVCAYINEPEWGSNIYGFDIFFNASDTYAINASNCDGTKCNSIECIAGLCKTQTVGGGGILVTGTPNWIGFENINFSWSFDDNVIYTAKGMLGAWFNKTFGTAGSHWAKLTASINPSGSTETEFSNYINSMCSIDLLSGGKWIWWDEFGIPRDPLTENGTCLWNNGIDPPDCCPPGYACQIPSNAPAPDDPTYAICQVSGDDYCASIVVCDDYPSQAECEADICRKGILQPTSTCGGTVSVSVVCGSQYFTSVENECKCEWDETEESCLHAQGLTSTIYQDIQVVHSCKDTIEHGECVDGLMNIKKTSELILDESISISEGDEAMCKEKLCPAYEGTIMCGQPLIKLLFFSLKNLIIAIIIIIIIYVILVSRKKNKIKKQRKKKKR